MGSPSIHQHSPFPKCKRRKIATRLVSGIPERDEDKPCLKSGAANSGSLFIKKCSPRFGDNGAIDFPRTGRISGQAERKC